MLDKNQITSDEVYDTLDIEYSIARGETKDGKYKVITINIWLSQYTLWVAGIEVTESTDLDLVLHEYNKL